MPTVLAMLAQSAVNEVDIIFFAWLGLPGLVVPRRPRSCLACCCSGCSADRSRPSRSVRKRLAARRFAQGRSADAGTVLANSWVFSLLRPASCSPAFGYLVIPHALGVLVKVAGGATTSRSGT